MTPSASRRSPVPGDAADTILDARLSALGLAPFANTARRLRFFTGDVEVTAKYRVLARDSYAAAAAVVVRLPTGHQDSPNDPFDLATGDHQTDIEGRLTGELTLLHRLWLNLSVRAARQLPGQRERRIGPVDQLFLPATTSARLRWDPGDYVAVDVAPLFRFSRLFAAGITFGYYTQGRDRYAFLSPQDSTDVAGRVGGPVSPAVLEAGNGDPAGAAGVGRDVLRTPTRGRIFGGTDDQRRGRPGAGRDGVPDRDPADVPAVLSSSSAWRRALAESWSPNIRAISRTRSSPST